MAIVGKTDTGEATLALAGDAKYVSRFYFPAECYVSKLALYGDSFTIGDPGTQPLRGLIYDTADALLAVGDPVDVPRGEQQAWINLPFGAPVHLPGPGYYDIGMHIGLPSNLIRMQRGTAAEGFGSFSDGDTYSDGPSDPWGNRNHYPWQMCIYAIYSSVWNVPDDITDQEIARLPFYEAQAEFARGAPDPLQRYIAQCGWHGTVVDEEVDSFALVRADGPLADLVGERLKITRVDRPRTVYAYCHDEADLPDEISLPQRLFLALGFLASDNLRVRVEVMA